MGDYQESMTTGMTHIHVHTDRRTDRQRDRQTDAGQSDPYVPLCFADDKKVTMSSGGVLVKLLTCEARGSEFDSRSRRYNFRDWLSPASKSRYGCNTTTATLILNSTNQPTNRHSKVTR